MLNDNIKDFIQSNKNNLFQELIIARKNNAGKEENFRTNYAIILNNLFKKLNMDQKIDFENEYSVHQGRIDSLYGNFIVEYKAPTKIAETHSPDNDRYIVQVQRHIDGLCIRRNIEKNRIIGVVFDGHYVIYIKKRGNEWIISNPQKMTVDSHALFLMRLLSVNSEGRALTVEHLTRDFGASSNIAKGLINHFYETISDNKEFNKANLLFEQWKVLYREVCGYKFDTNKIKIQELKKYYKLEQDIVDLECLIFAIQSYFALLIKFLSINVLAFLKSNTIREQNIFHVEDSELLKEDLVNMEGGGKYRKLGVSNFLEGDFFGWYLYLWDENTFSLVRDLIEEFNRYDYSLVVLEKDTAIDLLKNLYHELLPSILRKNLGEFYTPDWLADFTIKSLNPEISAEKSFLDPTCGSGTFVILLIKKYIENYSEKTNAAELLSMILNSVRGFDLNPLAVVCARANYIIALGSLLSNVSFQIEVPIYLCDSMLTILEGYEEQTKKIIIPTKAMTFVLPEILIKEQSVNIVLDIVNDSIQNKLNIAMFEKVLCTRMSKLVELFSKEDYKLICDFYSDIKKLDNKKLDGIWTNVIKNSFAPVFQKKVDYIIGNPPWIDWQDLPENYRNSIQRHWYDYRVFDHKGQKAQLGSSHDDISVLMTYVIMDNFLKENGELAFVINQNLLQASGGGDGFRKFSIKESIPVCVTSVNDFVQAEPFKHLGVSNKTATITLKKNVHTQYPLRYRKWYKHNSAMISPDTSLEVVLREHLYYEDLSASPINEYNSPWMITTEEKRNVFQTMINKKAGNGIYRARKGVDTSANGIFWVTKKEKINENLIYIDNTPQNSKKNIRHIVDCPIEQDLIYPLLRGKDIKKWKYESKYSIILPYNDSGKYVKKDDLVALYPRTYDYFYNERNKFQKILRDRATFKKFIIRQDAQAPEYSLYNIGSYTFAPYKVIWKALSNGVSAVTISSDIEGKRIIPDHNLLMVPIEMEMEAYYLSGILNSEIVSEFVNAYISWFISAHILERINIPKFDAANLLHQKIAMLSKEAHEADNIDRLNVIEMEINKIVYDMLVSKETE